MKRNSNELKPEHLSTHALNSFVAHNSSSRSHMFSSHFSQRLVTEGCSEEMVTSGFGNELAKYTFSVSMPANGRIIKRIDKFPKLMSEDSIPVNPEVYVIYEDVDTREIGHFVLPYYKSLHQHFGFKYKYTKEASMIIPGNFIPKGTVFADTPAVTDDGNFMYGVSMNMALMSLPGTSEDGVIIARSALKKLAFKVYETREVEFGGSTYPLNLYGTPENFKAFPEIGDVVREDGLIMMLRKMDPDLSPVDSSIYDMMEPDYNFDKGTYARGGGKIVDIRVYHDKQIGSPMPENIMFGLEKYARATVRFFKDILDTETQLNKERRHKHGEGNIPLKPGLHSLVVKAMAICNEKNYKSKQKLNMIYRTAPLPEYRVEFVIESTLIPTLGFKITDKNGGKGVICTIREDHEMPLASDGLRADVVMDPGSNIGRMNLGRIYEQYMGSCCVTIKKRMIDALGIEITNEFKVLKQLVVMTESHPAIQTCYEMLNTFFGITSPKQFAFFNNLIGKDKLSFIATSIVDELQLYWPIDNNVVAVDTITQLEKFIKPTYGQVTYTGLTGNLVTTDAKVRIAPLYMMLLEKIGDSWSAVSSSKLQHFGVPSGMTKSEKFTIPYRSNPVKTAGETEARIFVSYLGEEPVAEMLDRSNNPVTHRAIVDNILMADKPTNVEELVDRDIIPLGNSKPLQLIGHLAMCGGWRFKYEEEQRI